MEPKNPKHKYIFPILSYDKLVNTLAQANFNTTAADLQDPTCDLVTSIFAHMWDTMGHKSYVDTVKLLSSTGMDLEDPTTAALYEDAMIIVVQFSLYQGLLHCFGVKDATLSDMLNPDAKRFRQHLSALANFMYFDNSINGRIDAAVDPKAQAQLFEALDEQTRKCEEAKRQYEEWKLQIDEEFEACQKIQEELAPLEAKSQQVAAWSLQLEEELENTDLRLTDLNREELGLQKKLKAGALDEEEAERLTLKHCPTQLRQKDKLKEREINELQSNIAQVDRRRVELETEENLIRRSLQRDKKDLTKYKSIKTMLDERKECARISAKQVKELENQRLSVQAEIRVAKAKVENLIAEKEQTSSQTLRLQSEAEQKLAEYELEKIRIEEKKKAQAQQILQYEREAEEIRKENAQLREIIRRTKEAGAEATRRSDENDRRIFDAIDEHHQSQKDMCRILEDSWNTIHGLFPVLLREPDTTASWQVHDISATMSEE
eukprot:GEMP01029002.1.p1 GENE.GEMP01029002.1~~GEMP01029002.1.p1  ORF type:complete len:491 (+),score=104.02 GEMP01029002.1:25-1497(+)